MTEKRVYKLILEPEDIDTRIEYVIENAENELVTELDGEDAFDYVLSNNEGYYLESFEIIDESEIPSYARPYQWG